MPPDRGRAPRLDPDTRRGLILDAAERLLAEDDPLLVTFEQIAAAAGVSRPLVHAYLGDRRALVDAVQVRIIGRLGSWLEHGLLRADTGAEALRALTTGLFAFVEAERDAWTVLVTTGGLDNPAFHSLRSRWTAALLIDDQTEELAAQALVGALVLGVGPWVTRGVEPSDVLAALRGAERR